MKRHTNKLCLVTLVTLLVGLMPYQQVHAVQEDDITSIVDEVVNSTQNVFGTGGSLNLQMQNTIDSMRQTVNSTLYGTVSNYEIYGESFDILQENITNENYDANSYLDSATLEAHLYNYSTRLSGLTALLGNSSGPEDNDEYSDIIGLANDNRLFSGDFIAKAKCINGNWDNVANSRFLNRDDVKNILPDNPEREQALRNTLLEYIYYGTVYREDLVKTYKTRGTVYNQDSVFLEELHKAYEFSLNKDDANTNGLHHYDFINKLWTYKDSTSDDDYSLKDLYEISLDPTKIDTSIKSDSIQAEYEQPLKDFYTVNVNESITVANVGAIAIYLDEDSKASETVEEVLEDSETDLTVPGVVEIRDNTNLQTVTLSEGIVQGISYSAGYIPMQTNLYSAATVNSYDGQWLTDFHYKYGFMRKALYMDTSATAAMDYYNSRGTQKGNTRVCTLRDFLELGDKDLLLYIDGSFYNSEECEELVEYNRDSSIETLKEFTSDLEIYYNTKWGKDEITSNTSYVDEEYMVSLYGVDMNRYSTAQDVKQLITELKQLIQALNYTDPWDAVVKTGDYNTYSSKTRSLVRNNVGEYVSNLVQMNELDIAYDIVMNDANIADTLDCVTVREEIDTADELRGYQYTTYDEYTPALSFAYVSAIYKNEADYKISSLNEIDTPVFIASDDVCQVRDATMYDRQSLINYMLVRNLNSMVQIDYTYSMDMDCPVYMDIYGNIITQSGLVVIPAACNATLYPDDYVDKIFAAGLFLCYGNDWCVSTDYANVDRTLGSFFYPDEQNGVWLIDGNGIEVDGTLIDFANMSVYNDAVYQKIQEAFKVYIREDGDYYTHVIWPKYVDIINEVMRGAPLEHIDAVQEGLSRSGISNKTAIVAAAKLESLIDSLSSTMTNTLIALPDFNSTEHSEYIVAFLFKLLLIATVTVVLFAVYRDAIGSDLGIRTIWKCLCAVGLTAICVTSIPMIFQLTYYTANKMLLQKEVTKICMYNLEKSQSGIEIGVTKTEVPETNNKLMVQLDWVEVPWYKEVNELLFGNGLRSVNDAREEAMMDSQLSYLSDTYFYNDGVYMSVDEIFNSVNIDYTFNVGENDSMETTVNGLYLYDNGTNQTLSFYSPYYVFLTALTSDVNRYNELHNSYMYTTKLQSGNRLKTVGLCSNYFQSQDFMEIDEDILHLREVYNLDKSAWYDNGTVFNVGDVMLMEQSRWYNRLDADGIEDRLKIVNTYCREFIADNRELLDKVTDETFLKVMALSCAMKYNQVFGISEANCFEIYDLNSNDLLRLSLAKTDDAMLTSPMSFSRFVLTIGGEASVYAASVLEMIMYIGSFIKPICVLIAYISVFLSIFVFRVVLRKKSNNLLGYLLTVTLLSVTNFVYAILLKVSTYLPSIGLPMIGCIIFIIIGQVAYLLFLGYVTGVALKDWYNLGAVKYQESWEAFKRKHSSKSSDYLNGNVPRYENNWDYYNALVNQRRERDI